MKYKISRKVILSILLIYILPSCGLIDFAKGVQEDGCKKTEQTKYSLNNVRFEGVCIEKKRSKIIRIKLSNFDLFLIHSSFYHQLSQDTLEIVVNSEIFSKVEKGAILTKTTNSNILKINNIEYLWLSNKQCVFTD